jgi:nucleoside-diphosphate-sugar epimerase
MNNTKNVLVIGGAGYVGAVLVPKLLDAGHKVTVLDLYMYGDDVFDTVRNHKNLIQVKGDIRNLDAVKKSLVECDSVIHLACISNDPSFELDPDLGRSINLDSFTPIVREAKKAGVTLFIYASSSSVYGIKNEANVTEDLSLEPLTDYSKFKMITEELLMQERNENFSTCIIRPATVCGYSPRQRLDVIVNILTNHAVNTGKIKILGGEQLRPNIHIEDITDLYSLILNTEHSKIDGKIYNAGFFNHKVLDIGLAVKEVVEQSDKNLHSNIELIIEESNDNRSYHISSEKIKNELNFEPKHSLKDAITDILTAFDRGLLPNSMYEKKYFNIRTMQEQKLK